MSAFQDYSHIQTTGLALISRSSVSLLSDVAKKTQEHVTGEKLSFQIHCRHHNPLRHAKSNSRKQKQLASENRNTSKEVQDGENVSNDSKNVKPKQKRKVEK